MSFTAEVRDELARCEPECEYCDLSTLAALTRVSGTLSLAGSGRYRLTVATDLLAADGVHRRLIRSYDL